MIKNALLFAGNLAQISPNCTKNTQSTHLWACNTQKSKLILKIHPNAEQKLKYKKSSPKSGRNWEVRKNAKPKPLPRRQTWRWTPRRSIKARPKNGTVVIKNCLFRNAAGCMLNAGGLLVKLGIWEFGSEALNS
jgi:hypothetical protein